MSGEKTHAPTHKRLEDARKRGEVSQSKEPPILLKYGAFLLVFVVSFDTVWERIRDIIDLSIAFVRDSPGQTLDDLLSAVFRLGLQLLLLTVVSLMLAGMVGIFSQTGFLFSAEAAKPSFKKLNVINNIKQLVSLQTLLQLFLSLLKVVLFCIVAVLWLRTVLPDLLNLQLLGLSAIGDFALDRMEVLIGLSLGLFLSFAALDWWVTRFFFMKNLRMSHQDLVDEYKQTEGDPHVRQHRKQQHRSILESSLNRVSQAKLVVNNPSHISVALDYEPGVHDLPLILAMETDDMALLMRRKALEAGVPLVTHIPLARGLYQDGEVGQYIPSAHVAMAAEVFRQVLEQLRQQPSSPPDEAPPE